MPVNEHEIAGFSIQQPLPIEDRRQPRNEVRLADEELAPAADLDNLPVYICRKRRRVKAEPVAPRPSPRATRISETSGNGQA